MKLIKKNRTNYPGFPTFFDDFFTKDLWNVDFPAIATKPSVNISETDEAFKIEVVAPGLKKEDIKVALEKESLSISYEHKKEKEEKEEKYTKKEFSFTSFKRSFNVPEHLVKNDSIEAKYENGILSLTLPKAEEVKPKPAKEIAIA